MTKFIHRLNDDCRTLIAQITRGARRLARYWPIMLVFVAPAVIFGGLIWLGVWLDL